MPGDWFTVQVLTYKVGWETRYTIRAQKHYGQSNEMDEKAGEYTAEAATNFGAAMMLLNEWIRERIDPENWTGSK